MSGPMSRPIYSGLFRGVVAADGRPGGKLMVTVPQVTGAKPVAALATVLTGWNTTTNVATFTRYGVIPGTAVWVMFEHGDSAYPVVIGLI